MSRQPDQPPATNAAEARASGPADAPGPRIDMAFPPDLYGAVLRHLPVSVTVQDEMGELVFANASAAAEFGLTAPEKASEIGAAALTASEPVCDEETVATRRGERTLLTAQRTIRSGANGYLVSASVDITARKEVERQLARRVHVDELTGLANRITLEGRVAEALGARDSARFALAFIDLDNFKHINDYYSHAIGDALLIAVGQRLQACLRATDVLARISGDEFVLLVNPLSQENELRDLLDLCRRELKRPFYLEGFEIFTSGSIGASVYPDHGRDYELLRRNADSAMYRAKASAKGGAVIFDARIGSEVSARMALEQQLRLAIRDRSFCCAFQPKVDLRSREVVGFETLIRWRDHLGVIHPPGAFIGLATELGLIDPITLFVLEDAADMIGRLDAAYGEATTISINVAAKQASDPRFMHAFIDKFRTMRTADRFMIELTEDAFVGKGQFQNQFLPKLRELGVKVSIDDFGTGYSSLAVLSDITADELKIDRSFITAIHQRPRSQSVLKAIESLGHALGMSIVAEGVESHEEVTYLMAATRIRHAQGFYFAKPFYLDEMPTGYKTLMDTRMPGSARGDTSNRSAAPPRLGLVGRVPG